MAGITLGSSWVGYLVMTFLVLLPAFADVDDFKVFL
jgi:hypothetical protein